VPGGLFSWLEFTPLAAINKDGSLWAVGLVAAAIAAKSMALSMNEVATILMAAHQIGGGLEPILARREFPFGLKEID